MNGSLLSLLAAALAGVGLGAAYMGLLWVAVRRLPQERGGVAVFVGLALARGALVLGALAAAAVLGVQAAGIIAALLGFVAVRVAATRMTGHTPEAAPRWR
jgi:F1F0 ATPase subunit 2